MALTCVAPIALAGITPCRIDTCCVLGAVGCASDALIDVNAALRAFIPASGIKCYLTACNSRRMLPFGASCICNWEQGNIALEAYTVYCSTAS